MKTATRRRALTVEMTSGSLWKNILLFSLPLMMTQVLEVLFNLSDVAIAGKYAYNTYVALGSVGSTTTLVTLFTGLLIGLGGGVNVAVARGLGMGNDEDVEHTTHSSFLICLAMGVLTCLVCVFFAEPMLRLLHTKEEFLPGAVLYLKLYALGLPAMGIYNCGNGILSATGDTKRPLLYLTVAGVLNVILNLVFVIGCGMAAEGVAIASAIAQWVSALLIIIHLLHRKDACRLDIRRLRLHHLASKRVLLIGIPSGLQNAIFAVANLFVQAGLNSFDEITVSGAAAAANADTLVFNMMAAFYTACASFVSRNWGAGRKERILKSYYISMLYAAVVGVLVGVLLTVFGREFLGLFADKPEVIDAGVDRLRIMAFSYWIGPLMDASIAASRGLGRSVAPTIMVILGSCVFRVIWIYTIFAYFHTITSLYLLYMFSWILTGVAEYIYFRITYKRNVLTARATWKQKRPCREARSFPIAALLHGGEQGGHVGGDILGEAAQRHAEGVIARLQAYQQLIRGDVAVHGGYGHGGNVLLTGKIHGGQLGRHVREAIALQRGGDLLYGQLGHILGRHGAAAQQTHVGEYDVDGHQTVCGGGVHILHAAAALQAGLQLLVAGALADKAVELVDLLIGVEIPAVIQGAADAGKAVGVGAAADGAHIGNSIVGHAGGHGAAGLVILLAAAGGHGQGHQQRQCQGCKLLYHGVTSSVRGIAIPLYLRYSTRYDEKLQGQTGAFHPWAEKSKSFAISRRKSRL